MCVCVCVCVCLSVCPDNNFGSKLPLTYIIWQAGSSWPYLGQVQRSCHWSKLTVKGRNKGLTTAGVADRDVATAEKKQYTTVDPNLKLSVSHTSCVIFRSAEMLQKWSVRPRVKISKTNSIERVHCSWCTKTGHTPS